MESSPESAGEEPVRRRHPALAESSQESGDDEPVRRRRSAIAESSEDSDSGQPVRRRRPAIAESSGESDLGHDEPAPTPPLSFDGLPNEDAEHVDTTRDGARPPAGATRQTYLFTWSHSDGDRVKPEEYRKEDFVEVLETAYAISLPRNPIAQMSVFEERHDGGQKHYHAIVMTEKVHRWKGVCAWLKRRGICLHASAHAQYYEAYRYCVLPSAHKPRNELDPNPYHSPGHPEPWKAARVPPNARAMQYRRDGLLASATNATQDTADEQGDDGAAGHKKKKVQRESKKVKVHNAIVTLKLKTVSMLKAYAREEVMAGRPDVLDFVLGCRDLGAFVRLCWSIEGSPEDAARAERSPLEIVKDARVELPCECNGEWGPAALGTLERNGFTREAFAEAVVKTLKGPSKMGNLFIHGVSNSGKSFMINPLQRIFKCFTKVQLGSSYALAPLPEYECVVWHEFEHCEKTVAWSDLLAWLEGGTFFIAKSKAFAATDEEYEPKGTPCFFTGPHKLTHSDESKSTMLTNRFIYLNFTVPWLDSQIRDIPVCGRCWSRFVLGEP